MLIKKLKKIKDKMKKKNKGIKQGLIKVKIRKHILHEWLLQQGLY
jgi:hypothetical protein